MWSRLRRHTFAPRRPAIFEHQYALAAVTVIVLVGSIALVAYALWGA